jgi:uncharacterized membrane protein YhfC
MTAFVVLSFISGVILIIAPIVLLKLFKKKWQLNGNIFWRAGFILLLIEIFYLAVIGNASSLWPDLWDGSDLVKALVVGISTGLFFELGRFLVLDKIFRNLRSFKEGVFFAMGWGGVETLLIGILLIISTFGMQFIVSSNNLAAIMPDAGTQEIKQVDELKQESIQMITGNPLLALTPVIERGSRLAMDLSLTMLVLLALVKGENKYVWMAVAIRALITFTSVLIGGLDVFAGDIVYLVLALFSLFAIKQVRIQLPKQLQ